MTPDQRKIHGEALLDNPVFKDCIARVNEGINRDMDKVKPNDLKTMQSLIMTRQAVNKIAAYIMSEATNMDNKVKEFNARPKGFFRR